MRKFPERMGQYYVTGQVINLSGEGTHHLLREARNMGVQATLTGRQGKGKEAIPGGLN